MNDEQYIITRRRVVRRMFLRASFVFNVIFFSLIMFLILTQEVPKSPDNAFGAVFFAFIYGAFLLLHGGLAFNLFGRFIDRATHQELERQSRSEKPKRSTLALGEDGELVEVEDEQWDEDKREKHGTNSYR